MANDDANVDTERTAAGDRSALLKRALLRIESLEARLAAAEKAKREPIAIVGMACRLPAGANDPEAFWELLERGTDGITDPPGARLWKVEDYLDPDPDVPGKAYTLKGGYIEEVDVFDAPFFGVSPREAQQMDPQQRWLLQVAWEALEDAGLAPDRLVNSRTGVYVGMTGSDFLFAQTGSDLRNVDTYLASGNSHAVAAGRLSYVLGLRGPAMTMDTACSSALLAVHTACNSLRLGECDAALAGGVLLILTPGSHVSACKARLLSPDGHCKTFDDAADGYVRAEGCAMIALKRLTDARRDGDRVLAVIRGSASNQDGRSGGLTAPSGKAQEAVIREALANAGILPAQVAYVEAHGTGTSLGDPIEVQALANAYGSERSADRPLVIGSVKSNIGHTEALAGVAGLVKLVLALQRGRIPGDLHFRKPNSHIPWSEVPLVVADRTQPWPAWQESRIGGLSSFGFSGTNVHMIVEQAPVPAAAAAGPERPRHLLAFSGKRPDAVRELAARHAAALDKSEGTTGLGDYCFTANTGRSHFEYRAAVSGTTRAEFVTALQALAEDEEGGALRGGKVQPQAPMNVAFLYPSAAAARARMGQSLFETSPTFRDTLNECDRLLEGELERPLSAVLYEDRSAPAGAAHAWPAMFALQWGLTRLWESWGVTPMAVTGQGVGEIAAACAAGILRFEDGLRLAALAGRRLDEGGELCEAVAVSAAEDRVEAIVRELDGVAVAAVNGPCWVVLSGTRAGIAAALERLAGPGVLTVPVGAAAPAASAAAALAAAASGLEHRPPLLDVVSGATGRLLDAQEAPGPGYWAGLAAAGRRAAEAARVLYARGSRTFIEIGPGAALSGLLRQASPGVRGTWLSSLGAHGDDWRQLCAAAGRLYVDGVNLDWEGFDRDYARRKVQVPTYPFERHSYPVRTLDLQRAPEPEPDGPHRLLGRCLRSPRIAGQIWEGRLRGDGDAFGGFGYYGCAAVPPGALLDAMLAAARAAQPDRRAGLASVSHHRVLPLADGALVQTVAATGAGAAVEVFASAGDDAEWDLHAAAVLAEAGEPQNASETDRAQWAERCADTTSGVRFYEMLAEGGVTVGAGDRVVRSVSRGQGEIVAEVEIAFRDGAAPAAGLADACLQALQLCFPGAAIGNPGAAPDVLHEIERFWLDPDLPGALQLHGKAREDGRTADLAIHAVDGRHVGSLEGVRFRSLARGELPDADRNRLNQWLYRVDWEKAKREAAPAGGAKRHWLLLADEGGCALAVAKALGSSATLLPADARDDAAELARRVGELAGTHDLAVVDCRGLDAGAPPADAPAPSAAIAQGCDRVLALARTLSAMKSTARPALIIVTRGAQPAGGIAPQLGQAPFVGLQRVLENELPELAAASIDLDPAQDLEAAAASLGEELCAARTPERQVALRNGKRLVIRLARADAASGDPDFAAGDGACLVTGGLGGIGLAVAAWLASRGARSLYLMGRRAPSARARERIAEIEAMGATVAVLEADVADRDALSGALASVRAGGLPLKGVFHAAGVIDDAVVANQTLERIVKVMRPKVDGAWHLHTLTAGDDLDHFVLFSAAAALFGNPGQSNYAAANLFLDGLAHHRRSLGLPALSVNWGAWSEVGMAAGLGAETHRRWAQLGVGSIAPEDGTAALGQALAVDAAQVAITPINWAQWRRAAGPEPAPFTRRLLETAGEEAPDLPSIPALLAALRSDAAGRRMQLAGYVAAQLAVLLGLSAEGLDHERSVSDLGFDSLMATTLKTRVQGDLGIDVPVAALLDGPSTNELADRVLAVFDSAQTARAGAADAPAEAEWEEGTL